MPHPDPPAANFRSHPSPVTTTGNRNAGITPLSERSTKIAMPHATISDAVSHARKRWLAAQRPDQMQFSDQLTTPEHQGPVKVSVRHHETFDSGAHAFTVQIRANDRHLIARERFVYP